MNQDILRIIKTRLWIAKTVILMIFLTVFGLLDVYAADDYKTTEAKLKVLLVSLEDYTASPLDYAKNDVTELGSIFTNDYGGVLQSVIDMTTEVTAEERKTPGKIKGYIEKKIETWITELKSGEIAILYLAGHGIKNDRGELCLPMIDFSRKNFEKTTIPMKWIRERLELSRSSCTLLVLDTCFSGTAKSGLSSQILDAGVMAKEFDQAPRVATFASSDAGQESWLWKERRHSLFTYWLTEALRGNADEDGNQELNLDELFRYVQTKVKTVSSTEVGMKLQEPILLNMDAIADKFVLRLKARRLKEMIDNEVDQIDFAIRQAGPGDVMVPEFTSLDSEVSPEFGTLARSMAKRLSSRLQNMAQVGGSTRYGIVSENQTRKILEQFTADELGTNTMKVACEREKIRYLVVGKMKLLTENRLLTNIELVDMEQNRNIGSGSGTAFLSEADVGQLGVSFSLWDSVSHAVRQESGPVKNNLYVLPGGGLITREEAERSEILKKARQNAQTTHPMLDSSLPSEVSFVIQDENGAYIPIKGKVVGKDYYIPLIKGRQFAINITNKQENPLFVTVLVDGLNTISQSVPNERATRVKKNVVIQENTSQELVEFAPRVDLDDAVSWILLGRKQVEQQKLKFPYQAQICGFYNLSGEMNNDDLLYRFVYVDADKALATRKNFTTQLGLITIAVYDSTIIRETGTNGSRNGGIGISSHGETTKLERYQGTEVRDKLVVVYNIHYVSQETFEQLK